MRVEADGDRSRARDGDLGFLIVQVLAEEDVANTCEFGDLVGLSLLGRVIEYQNAQKGLGMAKFAVADFVFLTNLGEAKIGEFIYLRSNKVARLAFDAGDLGEVFGEIDRCSDEAG